MILVNYFLQVAHAHGRSPQVVHLGPILFVFIFLWFQTLLTRHKLLLHQQVILHAIQVQKQKLALGGRREPQASERVLRVPSASAGRRCRRIVLLLLLIVSIAFPIPCTSLLARQPARLSLTHCSSSCSVRWLCSNFQ